MSDNAMRISRRMFTASAFAAAAPAVAIADDVKPPTSEPERDYPEPKFKPKFARPQLGKTLVQDFVIYAHSELDMVKLLLQKQPALVNAYMDWGAGDWESGLGGASHMGRRDIVEYLLEHGARIDIFCAAMLGHLETVKQLISTHAAMIDAKGPHGFSLHFHAKVGGKPAENVLAYLQSVKFVDLNPKRDATSKKGG